MIERTRTIYIGRDDSIPDRLRELLALADDPQEVQFVVGTRDVLVTEELAERWTAEQTGPDLDTVQEPTPAPRKRAPRKAAPTAAEES